MRSHPERRRRASVARGIALRSRESLNAAWRCSRHRLGDFLRQPSSVGVPVFREALYGEGSTRAALAHARAKLDRVLARLVACHPLWDAVAAADPRDVIVVDPFYAFSLAPEGAVCYAAPDLIVRPMAGGPYELTELKTGRADGAVDAVLTYALAARDGLGLEVSRGCVGQVIALDAPPAQRILRFVITPEEIDAHAREIHRSLAAMRALVEDEATGAPRSLDAFPGTVDSRCHGCAYKPLCHPDRYAIARRLDRRR